MKMSVARKLTMISACTRYQHIYIFLNLIISTHRCYGSKRLFILASKFIPRHWKPTCSSHMAVLYLGSWAIRQSALTRVVPSKIISLFYSLWYFLCIGAVNATFWIAWNRVTNQFNDCYKTCRDLKIIVGGRNMNKVTQYKWSWWILT